MSISVFPAKSNSALPQLQRRITTTGLLDLGTIRNCYFILAGGGGGGAGGGSTPCGGGAAGAIAGSLAFQQVHLTIGAGGTGGGAGGAGTDGGHSYMSRLQERAYNIQNAVDATYVSCSGGAGGNPSGSSTAGYPPNPGAPTISGVGSYNFYAGSPGAGSNGGASTPIPTLGTSYGLTWPRNHFISSWISNFTNYWANPTSSTGAGSYTYQPGFAGLFNTMHASTNNFAWDGTLRENTIWTSGSGAGGTILPYSGGAAGGINQAGGSGGDGLLAGGGGGGGTGSNQFGGVGGSNIFFNGQNRATGTANGAGGGGGGAGVASAGTAGANGTTGVAGAGGAGGLGGGGGGAGGNGNTSGVGGKGGDGVFLLFY